MSTPRAPLPGKLFLSAIHRDPETLDRCLQPLTARFGPIDQATRELPFNLTTYYHREMGEPLLRRFFLFHQLVDPGLLVEIKLATNALELKTARDGHRSVNLDPGILTIEQLVLATGKPRPHRPYLGQGLHAELALVFEHGRFKPLPWTYPDYAEPQMIAFLTRLREVLRTELKDWRAEQPLTPTPDKEQT